MNQFCYLCSSQAVLKCLCIETCTFMCNIHWKDHISSNIFINHSINPIEKTLKPAIIKQLELYYEKNYEDSLATINNFNANVETLIEQINDSRAQILELSEETQSKNYRHLQNLKKCPLEYLSSEEATYFLSLEESSSIENYLIEHQYFSYDSLNEAILLFNKRRNFIEIKEELIKTKEELGRLRAKNLKDSMDVEAYKQMMSKWDSQIKAFDFDLIRKDEECERKIQEIKEIIEKKHQEEFLIMKKEYEKLIPDANKVYLNEKDEIIKKLERKIMEKDKMIQSYTRRLKKFKSKMKNEEDLTLASAAHRIIERSDRKASNQSHHSKDKSESSRYQPKTTDYNSKKSEPQPRKMQKI